MGVEVRRCRRFRPHISTIAQRGQDMKSTHHTFAYSGQVTGSDFIEAALPAATTQLGLQELPRFRAIAARRAIPRPQIEAALIMQSLSAHSPRARGGGVCGRCHSVVGVQHRERRQDQLVHFTAWLVSRQPRVLQAQGEPHADLGSEEQLPTSAHRHRRAGQIIAELVAFGVPLLERGVPNQEVCIGRVRARGRRRRRHPACLATRRHRPAPARRRRSWSRRRRRSQGGRPPPARATRCPPLAVPEAARRPAGADPVRRPAPIGPLPNPKRIRRPPRTAHNPSCTKSPGSRSIHAHHAGAPSAPTHRSTWSRCSSVHQGALRGRSAVDESDSVAWGRRAGAARRSTTRPRAPKASIPHPSPSPGPS